MVMLLQTVRTTPSRWFGIFGILLVTLTGCPKGKDLPRQLNNGFEVAKGADLLGSVFADEDGWTAISEVRGNPETVWNEFASRSRSFTFDDIYDAKRACTHTATSMHCAAASHPEDADTEALVVTMHVGLFEPFGTPCESPSCGGSQERSFSIRYLSGNAAKTLPTLPRIDGEPGVDRRTVAKLTKASGVAMGASLEFDSPSPLAVSLPDNSVVLGTPVSGRCEARNGIGIVVEVSSVTAWMEEVLNLPTRPQLRTIGTDEIASAASSTTAGWRLEALGTRNADGDFVVLDLCPTAQ